jgi:hypothetical protein
MNVNIMNVCDCVLYLAIQHENCIFSAQHRTFICGLPHSTMFSTLFHKRHDFREGKKTANKICIFMFSITFVCKIYEERSDILRI